MPIERDEPRPLSPAEHAALDLLAVALEYAAWDEELIACREAWTDASRGPTLPRALFEKLCDVARRRDRAIKKAQTKRVTPAGAATRHFAGAVRVGPAGPTAAG